MVTFSSFSDILPDPVFKITDAGSLDTVNGNAGPGFASVKLSSNKDTQVSRTISGRGVHRESGSHHWEISINYNPMLRAQFDPVEAFLESRNSRLNPFYVILPQYSKPKDSTFASFLSTRVMSTTAAYNAGVSNMMIGSNAVIQGNPKPGDVFNIIDPTNTNHQKAYRVTRVETNTLYQASTTQPSTQQKRIHFNPPLERNVSSGSVVLFINPKFRVVTKGDVLEFDLNTDNLYSFSLSLEEIQP